MTAQLSREIVENLLQHNDESDSPANAEAWEVNALCRLALAGMDNGYDINASQLREAVHYNPETGKFMRRSNGQPMEHVDGSGYYCLNLFKKSRLAHRMAFYYRTGRLPERVDHIDGNRLNNQWKNLREATHAENMWNTGMISTNASGVKGVYWHKKLKRWVAEIRTNGKKHYVGSFVDLEEARDAIEDRRKELHGEFFNPCSKVENTAPPAPVAVPDFDEWSRRCKISLLLCDSEFREVAELTWSEACTAMLKAGPVTAATVPDWWKILPLIPSPSQWAAGQKAFNSAGINKVDAVYKAMVEAAPAAPEQEV